MSHSTAYGDHILTSAEHWLKTVFWRLFQNEDQKDNHFSFKGLKLRYK